MPDNKYLYNWLERTCDVSFWNFAILILKEWFVTMEKFMRLHNQYSYQHSKKPHFVWKMASVFKIVAGLCIVLFYKLHPMKFP